MDTVEKIENSTLSLSWFLFLFLWFDMMTDGDDERMSATLHVCFEDQKLIRNEARSSLSREKLISASRNDCAQRSSEHFCPK